MNDRDDLDGVLRDAYRDAPETAEPPKRLWRRTRRSLHERGLLRPRTSRPIRIRWSALAAGAALAGFLLGLVVGTSARRPGPPPDAGVPTQIATAAERVQGIGTDYSRALEALARSLDGASGDQVAIGQQVVIALANAHSELRRELAPGPSETGDVLARGGARASGRTEEAPLIWF